jgi:hypothetical protein
MSNHPTTPPTDSTWLKKFNAAIGPADPKLHTKLEASMQIKYQSGVGELIWAMTTCQPDIMFTAVKLSQSNSKPAKHHSHSLK